MCFKVSFIQWKEKTGVCACSVPWDFLVSASSKKNEFTLFLNCAGPRPMSCCAWNKDGAAGPGKG